MFKAGKSTHLTILATFAIVFIVIYLYYTITDLRKVQIDVAKLTKEVQALKSSAAVAPIQTHPMCIGDACIPPMPTMTFEPVGADDADSVATEEIKNILDRQDSAEEPVVKDEMSKTEDPVVVPEVVEPVATNEVTTIANATNEVTTKTVNVKPRKTTKKDLTEK